MHAIPPLGGQLIMGMKVLLFEEIVGNLSSLL